jgi:NAD(P)-dependent dehydrogenase (short-subunit alcohol dehydrogenase family)
MEVIPMRVRGRVAVVTGAAAGTGRVIARRLAADGGLVIVADVDPSGGWETARVIEAQGGRALFVEADMTSDEQVRRMIGFAVHEADELHVLVNNAGGGRHVEPHFPDTRADQWRGTLELNLGGAMLATQLAFDPMRRAGASPLAARHQGPRWAATRPLPAFVQRARASALPPRSP